MLTGLNPKPETYGITIFSFLVGSGRSKDTSNGTGYVEESVAGTHNFYTILDLYIFRKLHYHIIRAPHPGLVEINQEVNPPIRVFGASRVVLMDQNAR